MEMLFRKLQLDFRSEFVGSNSRGDEPQRLQPARRKLPMFRLWRYFWGESTAVFTFSGTALKNIDHNRRHFSTERPRWQAFQNIKKFMCRLKPVKKNPWKAATRENFC